MKIIVNIILIFVLISCQTPKDFTDNKDSIKNIQQIDCSQYVEFLIMQNSIDSSAIDFNFFNKTNDTIKLFFDSNDVNNYDCFLILNGKLISDSEFSIRVRGLSTIYPNQIASLILPPNNSIFLKSYEIQKLIYPNMLELNNEYTFFVVYTPRGFFKDKETIGCFREIKSNELKIKLK